MGFLTLKMYLSNERNLISTFNVYCLFSMVYLCTDVPNEQNVPYFGHW